MVVDKNEAFRGRHCISIHMLHIDHIYTIAAFWPPPPHPCYSCTYYNITDEEKTHVGAEREYSFDCLDLPYDVFHGVGEPLVEVNDSSPVLVHLVKVLLPLGQTSLKRVDEEDGQFSFIPFVDDTIETDLRLCDISICIDISSKNIDISILIFNFFDFLIYRYF